MVPSQTLLSPQFHLSSSGTILLSIKVPTREYFMNSAERQELDLLRLSTLWVNLVFRMKSITSSGVIHKHSQDVWYISILKLAILGGAPLLGFKDVSLPFPYDLFDFSSQVQAICCSGLI